MAPKVLLASTMDWPFPARLAGAFAALGARVEALCPGTSPLHFSKAVARLHAFSPIRPLESLARACATAPDLVIPCDDLMAELLWRLKARAPQIAHDFGNPGVFPMLAARNVFLREAEKQGVTIAETIAVTQPDDVGPAIARLGLPLVVKRDASWGGDGVAIARDAAAVGDAVRRFSRASRLGALARAMRRREAHFLVRAQFAIAPGIGLQSYIPGRPATSSIACWQGRLLGANHFDVMVSDGNGPATVIAPSACALMQEGARTLAAHFGLSGFFGLDYMRGEDGGLFLLEINPRATPTSHLALGPGRDLAAALLRAAGFAAPDRDAITQKSRIALFPQEMQRDPDGAHLAEAYHDLPDDPGLADALGLRALTRFPRATAAISPLPPVFESGNR